MCIDVVFEFAKYFIKYFKKYREYRFVNIIVFVEKLTKKQRSNVLLLTNV